MRDHTDAVQSLLASLARPHRVGHRCQDGTWANPHAGARTACPVVVHLDAAADHVTAMHAAVHGAAHDTAAATAVAEGMTGLVMADLQPEDREGWVLAARMAIEALAEHLDRDPTREARLEATRARLAAVGITLDTGARCDGSCGEREPHGLHHEPFGL